MSNTLHTDPFFSQVLTPAYLHNPYALLAQLRRDAPIYHSPLGPWVLTSHRAVSAALKHPDLVGDPSGTPMYAHYLKAHNTQGEFGRQALSHMQFTEGENHLRVRRVFASFINTAPQRESYNACIEATVEQLATNLSQAPQPVDFTSSFAKALPSRLICHLLGLAPSHAPKLCELAHDLVAADDPEFLLTPAQRQTTERASSQATRHLGKALIEHSKKSDGQLLDHLFKAWQAKQFSGIEQALVNLIFFVVAGIKTTTDLLSNTLYGLIQQPQIWQQARTKPEHITRLVEECLRWDSPIQQTPRFARQDLTLEGVHIPAKSHLMLMLGAANRDPHIFAEPDLIKLDRDNTSQHIGFGGGTHFCVGSVLARIETQAALQSLSRHIETFHLGGEPRRTQGFTLRGFEHLPLSCVPIIIRPTP
jgi:cytochrome P450